MQKYISILRGINLGSHNKVLMTDLKALYESLGFQQVITYIQSGNVVFDAEGDAADLAQKLEQAIAQKYAVAVPVILRTVEEWAKVVANNPFMNQESIDLEKLHVTFLGKVPTDILLNKIKTFDFSPDKFTIIGKEVHLHCPIDYGHTKLSNRFFEGQLKVQATTRNWNTVNKLLALATQPL
jgi:uncharacterized protein (DUF1697 family)